MAWDSKQALRELRRILTRRGFGHLVGYTVSWNTSVKWYEALDEALAYCQSNAVDPVHYLTSVVDTMGTFCTNQKKPFIPGMVRGRNAIDRYNRWLDRERERGNAADATRHRARDKQLEAECAFVEVMAAAIATSYPQSQKEAIRAAREVDARYTRDPRRRVIALSAYLHGLHASLPDIIVLRKGWTTRDVLKAAMVLSDP